MLKYILLILVALVFMSLWWYVYRPTQRVSLEKAQCPELSGRVVDKNHGDYETSRLGSNYYTSKNKFPRTIVYCENAQDVQNAIRWARCNEVAVRIRSGGHHHEGYSTGSDVLVIDVSDMKEFKLDKQNNIATIQPGLTNLDLYSKLAQEGLTHVGGTCGDVGISGLILTGGMGPLLRRVGLSCDSLVALELVDAKGTLISATKDNEHKDLLWASCGGGGGNFGVITSMQIQVFGALEVTWFDIGWDWHQPIEDIITTWQNFFAKPDKNWFSHLDLWAQPFSSVEKNLLPVKALGIFYGDPSEARKQLAPLLNIGNPGHEVIKRVAWVEAMKLFEDSTAVFISNKPEYRSTGSFINNKLAPEAIRYITDALKTSKSPLLNILLFSLGGAASEKSSDDTAYFYRSAKFFIDYSVQWLAIDDDKKNIEELDIIRKKLTSYTVGNYLGNADPNLKDYMTEYYGANVRKLSCIKFNYDPENFFSFEQSIKPGDAKACE
jgi:hypothetical protein